MRRARLAFLLFVIAVAASAFAKDLYLSIGGSAGKFRTDARIFNPSYDKDITIEARYLPTGNGNNAAVVPKIITVNRRTMAVYDDVVISLFGGGPPLGAVQLTSDDDFVATQRIFADESDTPKNGTLGQFVPGLDLTAAIRKGVLIQLRQNGPAGTKGTFRTNWGGVNPNPSVANIAFKLYDSNNVLAGTTNLTLQPFGVFGPANIGAFFGNPSSDLGNCWMTYESDQPIFVYTSVLDNGSEDPTFIPAAEDSGVEPPPPPPPPEMAVVTVVAENFQFNVTHTGTLKAGEQVKFIMSRKAGSGEHTFRLTDNNFATLIDVDLNPTPIERTVTMPNAGEYFYVCTNSSCGTGHFSMTGSFNVDP
jgi:plastocyanin